MISNKQDREMQVVYAQGDDWNGLFINGKLAMEDHQLKQKDIQAVLKENNALGVEMEFKEVSMEWMWEVGSFPSDISEVVWLGDAE